MTKFGQSKIKREIRLFGVDQPIVTELTAEGINFWVKGTKKKVYISWYEIVNSAHTPMDVPSHLYSNTLGFLQSQAVKVAKREAAKTVTVQ